MVNFKIRLLVNLLFKVIAMPLFIGYRLMCYVFGEKIVFPDISQLLSLFPGFLGILLRRGFYSLALKNCSSEITIEIGTFFPSPAVSIGSHVYIGAHSIIAPCVIADDVLIGSGVHVANRGMHRFESLGVPIRLQGGDRQVIHIGRDSWVGNSTIIMADIGDQCVIGAGSVVTKPVDARSVVAGNPARFIRKR